MAYKDKKDQAVCSKKHYEANKENIKRRSSARNKLQRDKNIAYVNEIKRITPCVDCGCRSMLITEGAH